MVNEKLARSGDLWFGDRGPEIRSGKRRRDIAHTKPMMDVSSTKAAKSPTHFEKDDQLNEKPHTCPNHHFKHQVLLVHDSSDADLAKLL